ncbi:MAG: type II toxin-antitoxin system PemK/MazF family toxin [Sphingopyxis sp.]|nr:type II toxin-antitoxin system PemK/MazF family toxin [Sphingopyxis sp.]
MKRGDIVIIAAGKPRPAVVARADNVPTAREILLCPFTSYLLDAPIYRLHVEPDGINGLQVASQIMVDKVGPVPRDKIAEIVGTLADADMARLNTALIVVQGLVPG